MPPRSGTRRCCYPPSVARFPGIVNTGEHSLIEQIAARTGRKRVLLLFDNLEHGAAGPMIARLLQGCPALQIVATCRPPLRMTGEHEFEMAPLQVRAPPPPRPPRADEDGTSRCPVPRACGGDRRE